MKRKTMKTFISTLMAMVLLLSIGVTAFATGGDAAAGNVAGAIENTWQTARAQVETVVNNVVFPVIDMVLVVMFFIKVGTCYFEYKKHGTFEFTGPCILFACLIFTLTAPMYIWTII